MEKGKNMIINLASALKHPGQSFSFSVEGIIDDIDLYGDVIKVNNPVKVNGTIMYTGNNFVAKGSFAAEYTTSCALCFDEVNDKLNCEFVEEYELGDEFENPDIYSFTGSTVDITKMVTDNICLNLPLKHLCTDECKGLCPVCGGNLNKESCTCSKNVEQSGENSSSAMSKKENPFAVLENLFSDEDEEA